MKKVVAIVLRFWENNTASDKEAGGKGEKNMKYSILSFVNGVFSSEKEFKTLKEAKENFPSKREVKEEMKRENQQATIKFNKDDYYNYTLENNTNGETVKDITVFWGDIK